MCWASNPFIVTSSAGSVRVHRTGPAAVFQDFALDERGP